MFSSASGESTQLIRFSWKTVAALFYSTLALTLASGLYLYFRRKGAYLFSLANAVLFPLSILALISYISPYIYELPAHHCPFCILHGEYGFVGYPLYLAFLAGGVTGLGVGAISPFSRVESLKDTLPRIRKELTLACLLSWTAALAISSWGIPFSNLRM